uniref:Uncharacterized protein n=1 Tax=Buteo japonicus TaxID=224669 RepID=A0A8B9Z648_9AVES
HTRVYTDVCRHVHAHMHIRAYVDMHVHAQVCVLARTCTCLHIRITELSKEVFRLKEALNALPESRGPPQSPPNTAALQARIRALEEKLQQGCQPVGAWGHMDEDVQRLLCQILKMQRLQEQGR